MKKVDVSKIKSLSTKELEGDLKLIVDDNVATDLSIETSKLSLTIISGLFTGLLLRDSTINIPLLITAIILFIITVNNIKRSNFADAIIAEIKQELDKRQHTN